MGFLIKSVAALIVAAFLALVGYSYFPGALTPAQGLVSKPVMLNAGE